jgi:hypothetical protein
MRRVVTVAAALLLAGGVGVGAAGAAGPGQVNGKYTAAQAERAAAEATVPVDTGGNARLVVFVDGNNPRSRTIKRAVGVQQVTNPVVGRFCVNPTDASGVSPGDTVPTVATEYIGTSGFDGFAQWNSSRQGCPVGTFTVNTFDASTGTPLNDVAFTFVVP